eukprot:1154577-Pelagomonas_calceolata.AAC.5
MQQVVHVARQLRICYTYVVHAKCQLRNVQPLTALDNLCPLRIGRKHASSVPLDGHASLHSSKGNVILLRLVSALTKVPCISMHGYA